MSAYSNGTGTKDINENGLYCHLVMTELQSFLQLSTFPFHPQYCEFPLICGRSNTNIRNLCSTNTCLHPHPYLLSMTPQQLFSLPIDDHVIESHRDKMIGEGAFGTLYKFQYDQYKYIVKIQPIKSENITQVKYAENLPMIEFERGKNAYVTHSFICEALSLYALNRQEQEHGSFSSDQTHTVPIIYYTLMVSYNNKIYSAIVMENLQPAITVSTLQKNDIVIKEFSIKEFSINYTLNDKINRIFENMESSPISLRHYDAHLGNIMVKINSNKDELDKIVADETDDVYIIDFGQTSFAMPREYLCTVVDPVKACHNGKIYFKSLEIFKTNYNNIKNGNTYESSQFERYLPEINIPEQSNCGEFSCTNQEPDIQNQLKKEFPKKLTSVQSQTRHLLEFFDKTLIKIDEQMVFTLNQFDYGYDEIQEIVKRLKTSLKTNLVFPDDLSSLRGSLRGKIKVYQNLFFAAQSTIFRILDVQKKLVEDLLVSLAQDPNTICSNLSTNNIKSFQRCLIEYNQAMDNLLNGVGDLTVLRRDLAPDIVEKGSEFLFSCQAIPMEAEPENNECIVL